jgi:hypothetical protein
MDDFLGHDYEVIAKSQTAQVLGGVGAKGDIVERLVIVPETTAAGTVALIDGTGDGAVSTNVFVAGTLTDLHPIVIELGARSIVGKWYVTTGDNVHVIAVGKFS